MIAVTVWLLIAVSANQYLYGTPVTLAQLASEQACEYARAELIKKNKGGVWHCVRAEVAWLNGETK